MISITNILKGSDEQNAGFNYLPNSRTIGPGIVTAGRYYLIAFSLKTSTQNMPWLMSANSEDGLVMNPIVNTVINTTTPLNPEYPMLTNIYKSIGVYLYGGYCTQSNSDWGLTVTFGRCDFSSFAFSIDEVQGSITSPIVQTIASHTNSGVLSPIGLGNAAYVVGMSMLQNESFPMQLSAGWSEISNCFEESIVPNLITGYNTAGDVNAGWSNGSAYPWLEKATLACELAHS